MSSLAVTAPAFVEMAHRIVWCTVATVDASGSPRTRVLHPIWEWDGTDLHGYIATSPNTPKARHLAHERRVSLTYWAPTHDTCTADCTTDWELSDEERQLGWDRFATTPEPLGYDPRIIPNWQTPTSPEFGILRLTPTRLRVMPGSYMIQREGELHDWRA
jgi:hypothetical protein